MAVHPQQSTGRKKELPGEKAVCSWQASLLHTEVTEHTEHTHTHQQDVAVGPLGVVQAVQTLLHRGVEVWGRIREDRKLGRGSHKAGQRCSKEIKLSWPPLLPARPPCAAAAANCMPAATV